MRKRFHICLNTPFVINCLLVLLFVFNTYGQENTLKKQPKKSTIVKSSHPSRIKIDTPECFVKQYHLDDNAQFAFVGEKIAITLLPREKWCMDACYKARYKILQLVYGNFQYDTIEFIVYSHRGKPKFSDYKNVLLFVTTQSGTVYHEKYLFNDVYETKDGRWAGCYAWEDYKQEHNKNTKIKPVKIDFKEPPSYTIDSSLGVKQPSPEVQQRSKELLKEIYPSVYYNFVGNRAIPVYGNYVEELFLLKKDGILKVRGAFHD